MKLTFTFRHLDHSDSLQNYLQDQIDRAGTFLLKEGEGHIEISKNRKLFSIHVSIPTHQKFFRATAEHFDVYSAVDQVVEKLEKQFLKTRKLNQNHKKYELSKAGRADQMNDQFELKFKHKKAA